jgi:glycosyltransferase involved in cell wall biosynthesis
MGDVLVATNRSPSFYTKFVRIVFSGLEADHDVTHLERRDDIFSTTVAFVLAILRKRPDVLVVVGSGFASVFACAAGKLVPGVTVLFYHQDFTYQHMRDFKDASWLRVQIERIQEGWPLYIADVLGTMTEYHERVLREKGLGQPFVRIPQGAYLDEFHPDKGDDTRQRLGIGEDDVAVCIMGTFNYAPKQDIIYGWTLLEALAELDDAPVTGVFIGGGNGMDYLEERIDELGIRDQVVLTGRVDHEELPDLLGAMDASILVKPDHPADKMTTTMKLPEYLSAGTYMVADDHAYASTILDEDRASLLPYEGIRDDAFPARLAEELRRLAADRDQLNAGKNHSREVAEEVFDYHEIQARLAREIGEYVDD